uniref:Proteasome assembly chaperone 2 n=1 Tax=Polytomella parva TaxID=51329 RepID=A0A7S0YQL2_9CHLO|mmetsp:Transcript_32443/g.58934  ORF Transcript_32443/g.58934 Transcript_32443/m.58934 type:complete len:516 (+) Transcript_32443:32-1579(+)
MSFYLDDNILELLKDSLVILPAIAPGNIGELAIDILLTNLPVRNGANPCASGEDPSDINTYQSKYIRSCGYYDHPALLPCVGRGALTPRPLDNSRIRNKKSQKTLKKQNPNQVNDIENDIPGDGLNLAFELFQLLDLHDLLGTSPQSPHRNVFLAQQRSPAMRGQQAAFSRDLIFWLANTAQVGELLILSGLESQLLRDAQIRDVQATFNDLSHFPTDSEKALFGPQDERRLMNLSNEKNLYGNEFGPHLSMPNFKGLKLTANPSSLVRYLDVSAPVSSSSPDGSASADTPMDADASPSRGPLALRTLCHNMGLKELESEISEDDREIHSLLPPWTLVNALASLSPSSSASSSPTSPPTATLLTCFAVEGDNGPHALALARVVVSLIAPYIVPVPTSTTSTTSTTPGGEVASAFRAVLERFGPATSLASVEEGKGVTDDGEGKGGLYADEGGKNNNTNDNDNDNNNDNNVNSKNNEKLKAMKVEALRFIRAAEGDLALPSSWVALYGRQADIDVY